MPSISPQALKWYEDPKVLKDARKKYGITQTELAKRAGVKLSLIANIESGRRRLSKDVREPIWHAIGDIHGERQAEIAAAERDVDRWLQNVERARIKYPDFDEVVSAPHMAALAELIPLPPKDPEALKLWKKSEVKNRIESRARLAREYGSYENYQKLVDAWMRVGAQEHQNAALRAEVTAQAEQITAQAEQITALRDLLDLKTKEVLLRDKIEGEPEPASTEPAKPHDD
jgi:transcriptional regulator with XRE-family HTH domain